MVWVDRFVIEDRFIEDSNSITYYETVRKFKVYKIIYDRVKKEEVITISTGDEIIDEELAESILTMLNIKYMGKKD